MKTFDLIRIAAKNIKGFWTALIAFGMAAAAFCFCFAGAILVSVSEEQGMPYELEVAGSNSIKDADIAKISAIPDVKAATLVFQVPATLETGEYSAELVLTGMDSSYINEKFSQGGVYPDSSVMPYIILNGAACKAFEKPGSIPSGAGDTGDGQEDVPDINWLSTGFTVSTDSGKDAVIAKACGILAGEEEDTNEEQQPESYISIVAAKELLKAGAQDGSLSTANVRIENIGSASAVSQAIEQLGYQVSNSNEDLQKKWDGEWGQMAYLIVIGSFILISAALLSAAGRKISVISKKETFTMFLWMGMKEKELRSLSAIHSMLVFLIGITIGIIIALMLPSFLSQDLNGISVYMLPIPLGVVGLNAAVCIIVGIAPLFVEKKVL